MFLAGAASVLSDAATRTLVAEEATSSTRVDNEFRIVWGGAVPRTYVGTLSIDNGSLRLVRNLSLETDSVDTIRSANLATLNIAATAASTFGGADIQVQGATTSELTIAFVDPFTKEAVEQRVTVGELLSGNWMQEIDGRGSRIAIERQAHDRIRVRHGNESSIFRVGESWPVSVEGSRTGLAPGQYSLRTTVSDAQTGATSVVGDEMVTVDIDGNFAPVQLEIATPAQEGVYQLEFAIRQRRFLNSFLTSTASPERRLEFVAFDAAKSTTRISGWQTLATMEAVQASKPGMFAWLSPISTHSPLLADGWQQMNPMSGVLNQPISHGDLDARDIVVAGVPKQYLTLRPNAWLAIPLGKMKANTPHRLLLRVPTDRTNHLAVSIKQTSTTGRMSAIGNDYQVSIDARDQTGLQVLSEHELIFWPSVDQNYLVVGNQDSKRDASLFDIQVEQATLEEVLGSAQKEVESASSDLVDLEMDRREAAPTEGEQIASGKPAERLVAFSLEKPILADCFASGRVRDLVTEKPLESWETLFNAAQRVTEFLEYSGGNALILKVYSEGGAIFPSQRLKPSVRFDSGTFFSDGRSPDIKDAVELMMQQCDRRGIRMILALDFDSALPGLARWENQADVSEDLFQQKLGAVNDLSLQSRRSARAAQGRYDPLNSKVQSEIESVIRDVVNRYKHHRAFAGIELQIDRDSNLAYAGDRWGYSDHLLSEFERHLQARVPPRERWSQSSNKSLRLAFINWRASRLNAFYDRLANFVSTSGEDAKLYLNATRLWDRQPESADFFNPEAIVRTPTEFMATVGLDVTHLRSQPNLVLMQGKTLEANATYSSDVWVRQIAQHHGLTSEPQAGNAAIVTQTPGRHRFSEMTRLFDLIGAPATENAAYPIQSMTVARTRQQIVEQMFESDLQLFALGTWLPNASQVSGLKQLRRTLKEFPAVEFKDFPVRSPNSNLRVRSARYEGKSYLQIINYASWQEEIALVVQASLPAPRVDLLGGRDLPLQATSGQGANSSEMWQLDVPPYDVIGIEIADPLFKVLDVVHSPPDSVLEQVGDELAELETLILQSSDPTQQTQLSTVLGDFEQWNEANEPAGWNVSSLPGVTISPSREFPHAGRMSLLIENQNAGDVSAWVQSGPIPPPANGRLDLQLWLRTTAADVNPRVRVSVVGRTRAGERYERWQQFGPGANGQQIAFDWGTRPSMLSLSDIPSADIDQLFISIELVGQGKVWVDDVQVLESLLHPDERIYLQGRMFVAKQKLSERNPFPAEQLLDSHWGRYLAQYETALSKTTPSTLTRAAPENETDRETQRQSRWDKSPNFLQQLRERWRR